MRGEKEGRSKQGQTNNKAKQHSTPKAVTFPKENELFRVGLEPTTLYTLDRALYHRATKAAQLHVHVRDCACINGPFSAKVEFSAGPKILYASPLYQYTSKNENPNNFRVESLNRIPECSVCKLLFNGVLTSEFIKCTVWVVYANMVAEYCIVR